MIEEADRQAVILALAILSLDRPGWLDYLRRVAGNLFYDDSRVLEAQAKQFDDFRQFNADRFKERL